MSKIFNIPEINQIISLEVINIKSFALINRCSYFNVKPILKYLKKYYEYLEKMSDCKENLILLRDMYIEKFRKRCLKYAQDGDLTCHCFLTAKMFIVKKQNQNEGREFFKCKKQRCEYFEWADDYLDSCFETNLFIDYSLEYDYFSMYIQNVKITIAEHTNYFYDKTEKQINKISKYNFNNLVNSLKIKLSNFYN